MPNSKIIQPFSHPFLNKFLFYEDSLTLTDETLRKFDQQLLQIGKLFADPDIETNLISKNELLASFAISKAENSSLTLKEAKDVYALILNQEDFSFIAKKLNKKQQLTQKDHDRLEFYNIAKTFRLLNQTEFKLANLNLKYISQLHALLTNGLDIFYNHLPGFTVYRAGSWRDNDLIRVSNYIPAPAKSIKQGVTELITYLEENQNITGIAVFHAGLYALHPFNNGNKRVCRILEHLLLRALGYNQANLYSTSYYYHTQKKRYYKYLLASLEKNNLTFFTHFFQEALSSSLLSTLKTTIEVQRSNFLQKWQLDQISSQLLTPLIKRKELQFKHFLNASHGKIARQTLVDRLQQTNKQQIVTRRTEGKKVYYSLNLALAEEQTYQLWLSEIREKIPYLADDLILL